MTTLDIDTSLNAHLGLRVEYKLGKYEAFKLYQYFFKLFPCDKPIEQWRIPFYVDKHGDFINNPKNKQDYVVKAIHDNMSKHDQFETLMYIEYYKETQGFTRFDNDT